MARRMWFGWLAGMLLFPALAQAFPNPQTTTTVLGQVASEVIVGYRAGTTENERADVRSRVAGTLKHRYRYVNVEVLRLPGTTAQQSMAALQNHPSVEFVEPNYVLSIAAVPNDPQFSQLWGLQNTGQTGGTPGADIDATLAWNVTTGSGDVKIGVIDTGVDWTHPDLAPNIWTNPGEIPGNLIDDDNNGYVDDVHGYDFANNDGNPMDDHGHGTHTSGTIAAVGNNGIGVTGINWQAKIVGIKFLDGGGFGTTENAVRSVEYAITVGVRLTNNSWGGGEFSTALQQAIEAAGNAGQLFVAAAGNASTNIDAFPFYPAAYPSDNIVTVAATNHNDQLSYFSNYGATSVDLAAPGENILSTVPGGGYFEASGTSMATPHVTGVLALLWGRRPGLSPAQAKALLLSGVDTLSALNGFVLTNGRLNALLAVADRDTIPPGTILDLAASLPTSSTVTLSWHATGDDGGIGQASSYDIRYSTNPIDEANFGAATRFTGGPAPQPAGGAEHAEVLGLGFSTHYYFAVRALDEFANPGPISNVAQATTLGAPQIDVQPSSLTVSLPAGASTHRTLTLRNIGEGTLDFAIPNPRIRFNPVPVHPYMPSPRGAADPRRGTPVVLSSGGPDGYGYRWIDSGEPGGPVFDWEDISLTGTPIDLVGDEDVATGIPIGFTFPFYGTSFSTINVGVNGWLSFTSSASPTYSNQPLPSGGVNVPENLIAPFWTDLYFGTSKHAYVQADGERLIISWVGAPYVYTGLPLTFQAILYPSGEIRYQYLNMPMTSDSVFTPGTVGIQNATKTDGLTVAFNTPYALSGLAVRITPPANWLTVTPDSGRILQGQSRDLDVLFDSSLLVGGSYLADLLIQSNDPDDSVAVVPVQLNAVGIPEIQLDVTSVDFGPLFVGGSVRETLLVHNPGTDTLRVTSISTNHPAFTSAVPTLNVPPFGARRLVVRFSPLALGPVSGILTLHSNDADEPVTTVQLSGAGIPPPDIQVSPESLSVTLPTDGTAERVLRVDNTGTTELSAVVSVVGAANVCTHCDTLRPPPIHPGPPEAWIVKRGGPGHGEEWNFEPGPASTRPRNESPAPPPQRVQVGAYSGIYLAFGITNMGEVMPFQQPIGNEHFAVGTYLSGYGVGTRNGAGGTTYNFTAYGAGMEGIVPEFYQELVNTPSLVVVRVITRTVDNQLRIQRDFTFPRNDKYVSIATTLTNIGGSIDSVIFKEFADWDVDGDYHDDTFDYDFARNLVLAADVTFTGTASSTQPSQMDLLGWDSYYQFWTYVDFPTGPVSPLDGLALLHFNLGPLPSGQQRSLVTAHCAGNDLAELQAVVDRAVPLTRWLSVAPETLVVPPGGHRDLAVSFDATGMLGGHYRADVSIRSNDPDEEDVRIPVHLRVLGVPNIGVSPTSLSFDTTFTGFTSVESLIVVNSGTDLLEITGISTGHPSLTTSPSVFTLAPYQSEAVRVTFGPTAPGPVTATIQIHSSDPDQPIVSVTAHGVGEPPPLAVVEPDSIAAWLITGQTQSRTLTVRNTGGSNLACSLFVAGVIPVVAPAAGARPRDVHPAITREWNEQAKTLSPGLLMAAPRRYVDTAALPVIVEDPAGDPAPDLLRLRGGSAGTELRLDLELSGTFNPVNFGGAVSFDTDQNPLTGYPPYYGIPGQDIGAEYVAFLFTLSLGYVELYSTYSGFIGIFPINPRSDGFSVAIPLAALGGDDGAIDIDGVIGTASGPTDWFPNTGHAATNGAEWLSVGPTEFTVTPGAAVHPLATIDAGGLFGGEYFAQIKVFTDEPGTGAPRLVPVYLNVTGAPDLALDRAAIDFGALFVGESRTDSVFVTNEGTDLLVVTSVTSTSPLFTIPGGPFSLGPGGSALLPVTYHPVAPGAHTGIITFASNDPDAPATTLAVSGNALIPPDIAVSPESLSVDVILGQTLERTLTVANSGGSVLRFDIPRPQLHAPSIVRQYVPTPKGTLDPRIGPPVVQRMGGPDGFGYTWIDSHDLLNGPDFEWVDITTVGTQLTLNGDEDVQFNVPIGFPFPFYGDTTGSFNYFTTVNVASNGWMSFTDSRIPSYSIYPLPSPYAPSNLIAPFWGDLDLRGARRVYAYNDGTRFIVSWIDVPHYATGGPYTFQVIIDMGGRILFQYKDINIPDYAASIGVQNGTNDIGLQMSFFQSYVSDGMAVLIDPPAAWLTVDPMTGEVDAGASEALRVGFHSKDLTPGDYRGRILLRTNDPDERLVEVAAHMRVVVLPDIAGDPFDFGETYVGAPVIRAVTVRNDGAAPLLISSMTTTGPFTLLTSIPASISPGNQVLMTMRFLPTAPCASCTGALVITSNDPDENPFQVPLTGRAVLPPQIEALPAEMHAALAPALGPTATTITRDLTVENTGGSNLVARLGSFAAEDAAPGRGLAAAARGTPFQLASASATDPPQTLGSGTDGGGYTWLDSDDPLGPEYLWDDIVVAANRIPLSGNDAVAASIPIGFAFPFYGVPYTTVNISTNGWLSFTDTSLPGSGNRLLPDASPGTPRNLLAVLWDDLQVPVDRIYAKTFIDRFVVTYRSVNTLPFSVPHTFQVILYRDGRIKYQYLSVLESRGLGTVGIQNGTGTTGATVVHDAAYLRDELAVEFLPGPAWLRFEPTTLTVPPGGSGTVHVTFDASSLSPGSYAALIRLTSNDLDTPELEIPASLAVGSITAEVRIEPSRFKCSDSQGHGNYPNEEGPGIVDQSPVNWAQDDDNDSEDNHPRKWLRGRITLPNGYDPYDVETTTILAAGAVAPDPEGGVKYAPHGTLTVKFDRDLLLATLPDDDDVPVVVIGRIGDETWFSATTTLCLRRPGLHLPPGAAFSAGTRLVLSWTPPPGTAPDHYDLWFTSDGVMWERIFADLTGTVTGWIVPNRVSPAAKLELFAFDSHTALGSDVSDPFEITPATSDALTSVGRPGTFALRNVGSNPARGEANLELAVAERGAVSVTVYDVRGARVRQIVARDFEPGWHRVAWDGIGDDGTPRGAGVYFLRAEQGDRKVNLRIALVK